MLEPDHIDAARGRLILAIAATEPAFSTVSSSSIGSSRTASPVAIRSVA
jgi:hypothetical protein